MRVILKTVAGSKMYGCYTENSDLDIRGVYLEPFPAVLNPLYKFKVRQPKTSESDDIVYYPMNQFLHLLNKGNPNIVELLFSSHYMILSTEMELLLENKNLFLNKNYCKALRGFLINKINTVFKVSKDSKRYKSFLELGYDKKAFYHVERLYKQLIKVYAHRPIVFPFEGKSLSYLKDIRNGNVSKEYVEYRVNTIPKFLKVFTEQRFNSNTEEIKDLYNIIIHECYKNYG